MRPPPPGDYYPPPPPPVAPRNGSAPNPPPLPPRSTQYLNPTYATGPPTPYQTSPYGYQAPPPGPAPAPQSIPYFPPPPAGPGKPPPAPTYYSPNPPSSSFGTYSGAPAHTSQVTQSSAWYPPQPSYAPVQPATTHPQPAQPYNSYYPPPTAVQYNHGPAPINTTPAGPSYQPQYDPSSSYSPATYAPPPSSAPAATASQQQPYNFAKPQEHVAPPPSMPVSTPSQQQPYGFVNPQQHAVPPPSIPVSAPPQQQPYGFVNSQHVVPLPPAHISIPPQQQPYGFVKPQEHSVPPPLPPPSSRPVDYSQVNTGQQQGSTIYTPPPLSPLPPPLPTRPVDYSQVSTDQQQGHAIYSSPPLPPPSTRPVDYGQVSTDQQQGHTVYSPPIGPPAQAPSQTTSPGWANLVQMPPREPPYFATSQQTPTQKQNTQGAQDNTIAPSNHSYYPPLQQLAAQVKALNDQYHYLSSSNTTAPNPAQKLVAQGTESATTVSNDHYSHQPPQQTSVQEHNKQGAQDAVTTSNNQYYTHPKEPSTRTTTSSDHSQSLPQKEVPTQVTASNDHYYYPPPAPQGPRETKEDTQGVQYTVTTSSNHYFYPPLSEPPAQHQTTEGTQNQATQNLAAASNDSHSYPPRQEPPVQTTASNDHSYYPPPENPAAQKQTTQDPVAQTTSPNDHYFYPPPSEPIVQKQNTQGPQSFAVSSTDTYYCPPPPPLPPGPSVLSQAPQEQQPNPVVVYTESSPGLATTATVDPLAYNPFAPGPPPQHESNPPRSGPTDPATAAVEPSQPHHIVQHDPVAILSTQMNTLNVQIDEPSQSSRVIAEDNRPRKPAPIHATGLPNDVVPYCPETRGIDYSLYWYRIADIPEYLICTRCHADHIQDTSLASLFERVKQPDDVVSTCGFWRPRVKEILWPQAVRSNDIGALREYMKKRLDFLPCGGRVARKADEGVKWYGMTENEINGFIACEACYEDRVVGSAFESNFAPFRQQGADETWVCDLASPYISLAVVKMAKDNDWAGFVPAALQRIQCPECDGKLVAFNSRNWYLARRTIDEMHVCEACYLDKVALTRFGGEFERHIPATGIDALIDNLGRSWTCNLANGNIPMAFALEAAIYRRDFTVFWNAAKVITSLVPCTPHGIIRGNWWTVAGGCDGLSVCEACYNGVLQTADTAQFFEPAERDREATIVCSFCITSPRFGQFLSKYVEAQDRSVFSYYTDCVKKLAGIPPCPRLKPLKNGTWWGYQEILFCQDCHMSFVADTALGDLVPIKGGSDDRSMVCQIWSPRMRNMWLQTCAAGAPGSPELEAALDEFRAFGKRRMEVYNATVPQIDFIRQMKEIKMMSAMNQGMLSVMYSGMNSFASVAGTTDGNLHGSSSLGWYETENGATGAQMLNNMQAGMSDANRMDEWAQMAHLQALWSEVE